jgi:hypothetical protein
MKMTITKGDYKMIKNFKELMEVINQSGRLSDLSIKPLDDDQTVFTPWKSSTDTPIKEDLKMMGVENSIMISLSKCPPHAPYPGHHTAWVQP